MSERSSNVWFRAKSFGWGWYPVSWQGWVVTFLYVAAIIPDFFRADATSGSISDALITFGFHFIILTLFLLIICYARGEKTHWHWGQNSDTKK